MPLMRVRGFGSFGAAELPLSLSPKGLVSFMVGNYDAVQVANAELIAREFTAAGYGTSVVIAAIVNSMKESYLGTRNYGDLIKGSSPKHYKSIGLFQLNESGAGKGMTIEERLDPTTNARTIIDVESGYLKSKVAPAPTAKAATAMFCQWVERPKDSELEGRERAALAVQMFPTLANLPKANLPRIAMKPAEITVVVLGQAEVKRRRLFRSPWFWTAAVGGGILLATTVTLTTKRAIRDYKDLRRMRV